MSKGHKPAARVITISRYRAVGVRKGCPPVGAVVGEAERAEPCGCYLIEPAAGVVAVGDAEDSRAYKATV